MKTLAERLSYVMSENGITQSALAEMVGITQQSIQKIVRGETLEPKKIYEIATALGVDIDWLKTGKGEIGEKSLNFLSEGAFKNRKNAFRIDLYDYELAAGNGIINAEYPDVISSIYFTPEGLDRIVGRRKTDGICIFKVPSDSMMPTISPCDLVFIDTTIKQYIGEGIYAFRLNGEDYIKRLQLLPTGIIRALSDNKLYEAFDITEELFDTAEIIGKFIRVVPINPRDL